MRSRSQTGSLSKLKHNSLNNHDTAPTERENGPNGDGQTREETSTIIKFGYGLSTATNSTKLNNHPTERHEDGRASKRRRITEPAIIAVNEQKSTSRPISPPWKKIVAEGPTSFVEGGRRKSSRTNAVPLELQPPSDTRQTRSKIQTPPVIKSAVNSRYGGASLGATLTPTGQGSQRWGRVVLETNLTQSAGKPSTKPTDAQPLVNETGKMTRSTRVLRPPVTPIKTRAMKSAKASSKSLNSATRHDASPLNPHKTRRIARISGEMPQKGRQQKEENDGNISGWSSPEPAELDPNARTPRLRLKVRMPKVPIQHPGHVLLPRKFPSFRDWLEHDASFDGDERRKMTDEEVQRESHMRGRILQAADSGGVLSEEKCSLYLPELQEEPPRRYTHHDFLLNHALYFRKLMLQERNKHVYAARRMAHACMAEWKRRQPKTEEEISQEQKAGILASYRQMRKEIQLKWEMITAEVDRRRLAAYEEEQEALGKQALNKMLEQSTQLLDARRVRRDSRALTDDSAAQQSDVSDTEGSLSVGNDDDDDDDDDESNMSSSDLEEEEAAEIEGENVDEDLTVEELRRKYSIVSQEIENDVRSGVDDGDFEKEAVADMEVPSAMTVEEDQQAVSEQMHVKSNGEKMMVDDELPSDDSDESVDMDDDLGSSDEGDDEDEYDDDMEEPKSGKKDGHSTGLLGFFGAEDLQIQPPDEEMIHQSANGEDAAPNDDDMDVVSLIDDVPATQTNVSAPGTSHSTDPSTETSPETNATTKPSEVDSNSSVELHAASQASPSTTPQPTRQLKTPIPFLLRGTLREYQHYGLDWLAGLYANGTNGILADEMGLGKTIQTIALLAHLACEHEVWGPHLIVVPTSVMLNWEMEFKKWCPGFKILTYYGTQEERKQKRKGWLDDNLWHVCITSYQLVLQDAQTFKRRNWHYMVLDEAHNIKNFRSQRWQTLLTFKTRARLLLTGTPLQNNLTELWSLLFFLMPTDSTENGIGGFADLKEFSDWFRRPVEQILEHGRDAMDEEAKTIVSKLHKVLRPYLLRRLKADVEKQMPGKYEHVVPCRLSKRQRYLYDGFMARSQTRETLATGNYLSIINCLMQLRKVCNHPDLFETRQIVTSFAMPKAAIADYEVTEKLVRRRLGHQNSMTKVNLGFLNLIPTEHEGASHLMARESSRIIAIRHFQDLCKRQLARINWRLGYNASTVKGALTQLENVARKSRLEELRHCVYLNALRSQSRPVYGSGLIELLTLPTDDPALKAPRTIKAELLSEQYLNTSDILSSMVLSVADRSQQMESTVEKFACLTPAVVAPDLLPLTLTRQGMSAITEIRETCQEDAYHAARVRLSIAFPDKRLLQYDCGKLQQLDLLLRKLQAGAHRALIFTQMTKVLDILEQFLNIHGHRYLRLDGATKVEQRQILTDRFNNDTRILAFILSSRSGGLGINLTGADTVIFYDLDWNPAMDKQCQDRCHRIGQTRDVHIYRFVSEATIEYNIYRKANQKRMLDEVVIQEGDFTTDYFNKLSIRDMLGDDAAALDGDPSANAAMDRVLGGGAAGKVLEQVEDREDIVAAKVAEKEIVLADDADFEEKASSKPTTPGVGTPRSEMPPPPTTANAVSTPTVSTLEAEESGLVSIKPAVGVNTETEDREVDGDREEDEPGHIDDYMLRFKGWELKEKPIAMSTGKDRNRKAKHGKKGSGKGGRKKAGGSSGIGHSTIGRIR